MSGGGNRREVRPGSGVLFRNDRKERDTHPDYTGSITLPDGTEHWFKAWLKEGSRGKFLSVQIGDPKEERGSAGGGGGGGGRGRVVQGKFGSGPRPAGAGGGRDLDDDIPF